MQFERFVCIFYIFGYVRVDTFREIAVSVAYVVDVFASVPDCQFGFRWGFDSDCTCYF